MTYDDYKRIDYPDENTIISPIRLEEIIERTKLATEGPWGVLISDGYITGHIISEHKNYNPPGQEENSITAPYAMTNKDAYFISNARKDIPDLIDYIILLEKKLEEKE